MKAGVKTRPEARVGYRLGRRGVAPENARARGRGGAR